MSAFQALRDVCFNFECELQQAAHELYSAKIGDTFDECIMKKLRELTLFSSKLKLLRANPLALTPQIANEPKSELTLKEYVEVASAKVLERSMLKTLTHTHAAKALLTTADGKLDPEMVEKKETLIKAITDYAKAEKHLSHMEAMLQQKQVELMAVREQWDTELTDLRDMREETGDDEEMDVGGPLYLKLRKLVEKLEMMRWLLGRLVTTRGHRDWLAEPRHALTALKLARTPNTVEMFTQII